MGLFKHLVTCIILPNYLIEVWEAGIICLPNSVRLPWVCCTPAFLGCPAFLELKISTRQRNKDTDSYGEMLAGCSGCVLQRYW